MEPRALQTQNEAMKADPAARAALPVRPDWPVEH
jgi:hypothetical protein